MRRLTYALVGGVVVLIALLSLSYSRANRFEQQARDALKFGAQQRNANRVLQDALNDALARAGKRDTVLVRDYKNISEVDLRNPPPDSCKPNLAARDKAIADQRTQILDLHTALALARRMAANSDAAADSALGVLRARPGPLLDLGFLAIGAPKLGVFAGLCGGGRACYGAGVTLPIRIGGR